MRATHLRLCVVPLLLAFAAGCASGPDPAASPCPEHFRANYFARSEFARAYDADSLGRDLERAGMAAFWSPVAANVTFGAGWNATAREHQALFEPGTDGTTRLTVWRSVDSAMPPTPEESTPFDSDARGVMEDVISRLGAPVVGRMTSGMRGQCVPAPAT